jgi:hypothetical protein
VPYSTRGSSSAASTRRASRRRLRWRAGTLMRRAAQEQGALTISASTEVTGVDVEAGARATVHTDRGTVEVEGAVRLLRRLEPADRTHGRRLDPADARGAPDDHGRADPRCSRRRPARSRSRSSATSTLTCTSARTGATWRSARIAHRPILVEPRRDPLDRGLRASSRPSSRSRPRTSTRSSSRRSS